jgi:hypothetical protein
MYRRIGMRRRVEVPEALLSEVCAPASGPFRERRPTSPRTA